MRCSSTSMLPPFERVMVSRSLTLVMVEPAGIDPTLNRMRARRSSPLLLTPT